ncbi:MAG: outer membrane lipoprotein-sorting protein [Akkermansiaceae bacterium]
MKKFLTILTLAALTSISAADQAADRVLSQVRHMTTLQKNDLKGTLRKKGKRTPIALFLRGQNIQFQFYKDKKWEKFHMRLKDKEFDLFEIKNGKSFKFSNQKISQPIMETDLTYEDLAFRFLYWPNAKIEGTETIKTQKCHKIRIENPSKSGKYGIVYVWVHQKHGALMQVTGYDRKGKILKRFHVTALMSVGKTQTLKKMNVEQYNPATGKVSGITFMEFSKPTPVKAKPKGLR